MAERQTHQGEVVLFDAGSMSPLRIVSIVATGLTLGSFVLAGMLYVGSGVQGTHISAFERSVWATTVLVVFLGFYVAVLLYERRVAQRITLSADARYVRITTPTLFGEHNDDIPVGDLLPSRYHDGDQAGEESANQPWVWLQVRNRHSYVVPLSGTIPDKPRLLQVLSVFR